MTENHRLLRTVALVAGSLLFITAGVLANLLTVNSRTGVVGSIAVIAAIIAVAGIIIWRLDVGTAHSAISEEAALKRIKLILSSAPDRLAHWNVDIDLPMSIALKREGSDFGDTDQQTRSAFIASLTSDPRCTIITGAPGSGKSTLLRKLALQMATGRVSGTFRYAPLMLQCRYWNTDDHLASWVVDQTRFTYGITSHITRRWLNRGSAILILDGLDEISDDARQSFVPQLNGWLRSAVGGRAIVSCRTDSYVRYFKDIVHEQVANLEPLPYAEIRQYISNVLDQRAEEWIRDDAQSLLTHVISPDSEESSVWSTPLLLRLLADGAVDMALGSYVTPNKNTANDPAAMAVELGDRLRQQGNDLGAIESYLAAVNSPASQWQSLAGVRASLLLARSGDYERARQALHSTLATEIERSFYEPLTSFEKDLTDDERAVLRVLSPEMTLDAFQVSSLASIPPGRSNNALRNLRDRRLVEVADTEEGEPRFRRSSPVELVDQ